MLRCDVEELVDKKSRKGLFGYLRSGREAMRKKLGEIEAVKKNPLLYDMIIIGTPIWASNMSSPVRTYLSNNKGKCKKVAFFCVMGGESFGKAFVEMGDAYGKKPVTLLDLRKGEVMKGEHIPKLKEFAKEIIKKS
jgi:multimeric flavodoxin WrbA